MEHIQIGLDMAAFMAVSELYLASLQPQDTLVVIHGPDAVSIKKKSALILQDKLCLHQMLNDEGQKSLRLNRAILIAFEGSDSHDLFRGRTVSAIFNTPNSVRLPLSAEPSLATCKTVGLGRVYDILPEVVSTNPNPVSKDRYLKSI